MNEISTYTHRLTRIMYGAAALVFLLGLSAVYFYQKADPQRLFSENYHPYERRILRGQSEQTTTQEAYSAGKMDSVVTAFHSSKSPVPEDYLLTGIAFLEKHQPQQAIETFKKLLENNAETKSDFFQEDAEYYLAMGYLSNNEPDKAMPIFEKIQADAENPYNTSVSEWFMLNIKTAVAKQ
jgi:tetratricopeptide (TPR) repeat protein